MVTKKFCLVLLMTCLVLAHVGGDLNEPNVQVSEQNNGRMINQPTGRKGGFLFVDGPIIRPRPRPRPGLWRRRMLQQILNGSPSSLP
ncbi:uncharacterized protein LOC111117192 isoform X1 [Crassostrea virginica]